MKAYHSRQKAGKRRIRHKWPGFDDPPKFEGSNLDDDWKPENQKNKKSLHLDQSKDVTQDCQSEQINCDDLSHKSQGLIQKLPVTYWDPKSKLNAKPYDVDWCLNKLDDYILKVVEFEKRFGNTMIPKFYWEDLKLGRWCYEIKYMNYKEHLNSSLRRKLNQANFNWSYDDIEARWWATFHEARRYLYYHGHLNVPLHQDAKKPTKEDKKMKELWVKMVVPKRGSRREGLWYLQRLEEQWEAVNPKTKQYPTYLGHWLVDQKEYFRLGVLAPEKVELMKQMMHFDFGKEIMSEQEYAIQYDQLQKQTEKVMQDVTGQQNVVVRQEDLEFCLRLKQLRDWMDKYFTSFVPQNVFDNPELGEWQRWVRRAKRRGNLEQWKILELEKLKVQWKPHVRETQWWAKYHRLRKYAMEAGDPHIPAKYRDPQNPDMFTLSEFIQYNFKMYVAEKLSNNKLMALRVLGIKMEQPYGPAAVFLEEMKQKTKSEWEPRPDTVYEDQTIRLAKKALRKRRGTLGKKFDVREYFIPGL